MPGQNSAGRMPLHADNDLQPVDDAPEVGMQPSQRRLNVELNGTLECPGNSVTRWSVGTICDEICQNRATP